MNTRADLVDFHRRTYGAEKLVIAVSGDVEPKAIVADLAKRFDDVVLHLPLGLEDVDAGGVLWWDQMVVNEREDAELLHRNSRCPPLCK